MERDTLFIQKGKVTDTGTVVFNDNEGVREMVQCKDCKHRPKIPNDGYDNGFDIEFPDEICPCQCRDDNYYSWYPYDEWYCPKGER